MNQVPRNESGARKQAPIEGGCHAPAPPMPLRLNPKYITRGMRAHRGAQGRSSKKGAKMIFSP